MRQSSDLRSERENHGNLAYKLVGAGPRTITLLHGLYCCKEFWDGCLSYLSDCCAIAPDMPGHGDSSAGGSHNVTEHVESVARLLDSLDVKYTSLVGHSMGGVIALAFALAHPQRVERLVLVMTPFTERGINFGLRALTMPLLNIGAHALNQWYFRRQDRLDNGHGLWTRFLRPSRKTIVGCARGLKAFKEEHGLKRAAELTMPILCLHSPGDLTLGYQQVAAARTMVPQAEHVVVPSTTHAWPIGDEERFASLVNPFLCHAHESLSRRQV